MRNSLGFDTLTFKKNVSEILEYDYGDFMRAANVYLNSLRNELQILDDRNIAHRLNKMQLYLQFKPTWNIESTMDRLARDTKYIDELLDGHEQDWESPNSIYTFLTSNSHLTTPE